MEPNLWTAPGGEYAQIQVTCKTKNNREQASEHERYVCAPTKGSSIVKLVSKYKTQAVARELECRDSVIKDETYRVIFIPVEMETFLG